MDETSAATINVTVSARNITIMNTIQASLGIATVVNLPEEDVTTLTITVLPSNPVPFKLFSLIITTPLNA
ncbi:hypothetical protein EST38_g1000 [Candolleomyces aberdarensis]|uniref:Uncharacterized protein n=1 Tax=Candolleomyces aberdarensis TaxID=2316362 RepID=A0A4Q2E0K1_9AGAR|nr:hypothetical protein EST38_g1000 [Candolleomyces aberdarensis]